MEALFNMTTLLWAFYSPPLVIFNFAPWLLSWCQTHTGLHIVSNVILLSVRRVQN